MPIPFIRSKQKSQATDFTTLFRPHIRGLYQSAYRWTLNPEDAEDLVQDVAEIAMNRMADFASVEQPRSWLLKILYRRFVDLYRRRKANPVTTEHQLDPENIPVLEAEQQDEPEELLALAQVRDKVQAALAELDADHRVTVMLFDVEGYSIKEIAKLLDLPEGTVKSRLHRSRAKLKNVISDGTFFTTFSCVSLEAK